MPPVLETGFFGKVPSQGDFVAAHFDRPLRELLDSWLQRSLEHQQHERGDSLKEAFARMPLWRFVMGPESGSRSAVIGVMAPSSDRVGRSFPFFLVARLANYRAPTRALCAQRQWFEAAERLLHEAVAPSGDLRLLDQQIQLLPPLEEGSYRDLPLEHDRSFWWTESRRNESRRFASVGLPTPETFGRFLESAGDKAQLSGSVPPVELVAKPRKITVLRPRMNVGAATHPGTRLRINTHRFSDTAVRHLQALADGAGDGPVAGQAAELVIDRLARVQERENIGDLVAATKGALGSANTLLRVSWGHQEPPGAAVAVLISDATSFAVVWAGDIRLYLLREGLMRLLTRDHVEIGLRRRLSRYVGRTSQFSCETLTDRLQDGDRFLLVSASVPRIVPERLMARRLASLDIESAPTALVEDALVAGVAENISAIAVGVEAAR